MNVINAFRTSGLTLALCLSAHSVASAQTVEEFYKANTVTLVVSAAPGGAADFFAREFLPYLSKYIPGQPKIIVENQPGAGGMVTALQLQSTRPRDGTVIALLQRNNMYLPLVSEENKAFDPRQIKWLGSLNKENYTVAAWDSAPVKKAEDLFTTTLKIGSTSFANENRTFPAMLNQYFGTKFDIVTGYEGSEAIGLAMERGEVQGRMLTVNNLTAGNEAGWVKEGKLHVIVQVGVEKSPAFPDVPNITEFSKDPEVLALANFMFAPLNAGRPFAVPPGIPEDRLAALRKAFDEAAADPDFLAAMKKMNSSVEPITGQEVEAIIASLYATPESVVAKVKALMTPQ
ncbi:Bug family tripartite tricarboxylate transporter substrate binding protein [Phyllobacterium lublinensis]|uniref:Bug family tripartite tricarboxylate transporter substrate binding protein n=1 Tax=Phyllobacterium lublinensis TaxID=2875708 RepID=UPI001CCA9D9E|nr:tripartite tricarboxylate transporter substrate-binding protein [Phyllobacterium sp. 2063]MBZ9653742.1 hypothetical protein [Phyllobacterium sp. 2063]